MNNAKRLTIWSLIFTGVLLVVPQKKAQAQDRELMREEFHQTYPLSANGRISLENIQGAVRVSVWDRNEVKVDAVKTAYTRELLEDAQIKIDVTGDSLRIRTKYPDGDLNFNSDGYRRYQNPASVEYTLTVPRQARLSSIELVNGHLEIDGATGEVNASCVNGKVTARNLRGEVKLATVNGQLEATFAQLDETKPISLNSVNGSIVLIIPSDSNATIKAGTVHGDISNNFGLPVRRGDYVGRELHGQLGRGGARLKLGNVNGGINIRHAADNRPLSPSTSLLNAGRAEGKDKDWDDQDWEDDKDNGPQDAARIAREAKREAARAQVEAARAQREAARTLAEADRAVAAALRETEREVTQATSVVEAEGARAAQKAQKEVARVQRELARLSREDALNALRIYGDSGYRLVERDTTRFTDLSDKPRVNVETFDGAVIVRGWDKKEVVVNVIKRAANEQAMRGTRFNAVKNGNEININATFDKAFAQKMAQGVTSYNANMSLEIFVPRNVVLKAISGDGRLSLEGISGEADLRTDDGSIDVLDGRGRLVVKTGDGRIRIARFDGAAEASTEDGRITLEGRFTQLAARTGEGNIMLALPANFNGVIETNAESVLNEGLSVTEETNAAKGLRRWKIGSGGTVLSLRTGEGKIILTRAGEQ